MRRSFGATRILGTPCSHKGIPLAGKRYEIGWLGVAALVLLRITIGWHFLYQGIWKFRNPNFTSAGFLAQAKGPWADHFLALIPDHEGRDRLDAEKVAAHWQTIVDDAVKHFGLTENQKQQAQKRLENRRLQMQEYLAEAKPDIETYFHELERLAEAKRQPGSADMPFQKKRLWDKRKALETQAKTWLTWIDKAEEQLRRDLADGLTAEQRRLGPVPARSTEMDTVDKITMYSNVAIGLALITGLLTRWAALGGAVFLLSIVLSQPPWPTIYPPDPPIAGRSMLVNKEVVEMVGLLVIAAVPSGMWGGLDYVLKNLFRRRQRSAS